MRSALWLALLVIIPWHALAEAPRVVVSIKPLHSLAAALLNGIADPELLLDGSATPHSHAMRPSMQRTLHQADVVVWVGPELEGFLAKPLSVLPDRVRVIGLLDDTNGLLRLPLTADEKDGHGHSGHGHDRHATHDELAYDPHIWLSPANARAMAQRMATAFAPFANAETLKKNLAALDQELAALETAIAAQLSPLRDRPFVVFHPAYNYFVEAFGLRQPGIVTIAPELGTSARHLSHLREEIAEDGAVCVFREPQFSDRSIAALVRGTDLRAGVLDPLGVDITPGPKAYAAILKALAASMANCLSPRAS